MVNKAINSNLRIEAQLFVSQNYTFHLSYYTKIVQMNDRIIRFRQ